MNGNSCLGITIVLHRSNVWIWIIPFSNGITSVGFVGDPQFFDEFTGDDNEINIDPPAGHEPEFTDWRWERLERLPALIIPFKRPVYDRVVKEFAKFSKP